MIDFGIHRSEKEALQEFVLSCITDVRIDTLRAARDYEIALKRHLDYVVELNSFEGIVNGMPRLLITKKELDESRNIELNDLAQTLLNIGFKQSPHNSQRALRKFEEYGYIKPTIFPDKENKRQEAADYIWTNTALDAGFGLYIIYKKDSLTGSLRPVMTEKFIAHILSCHYSDLVTALEGCPMPKLEMAREMFAVIGNPDSEELEQWIDPVSYHAKRGWDYNPETRVMKSKLITKNEV